MTDRIDAGYTDLGRKIKDMPVGQSGYVTPWTMIVLSDLTCYLDGDTTWEKNSHGTVSLLITRTKKGYSADVKNAYKITFGRSYEWSVRDNVVPDGYIKVTEVLN